ncbi:MAG: cold shock domain-containing protein [Bacteroidota bacterium]
MGRSKETFNKKEVRKKKEKRRKEKEAKRLAKKDLEKKSSLEDMIAYVDEFGNLSAAPPDPSQKTEVDIEDIEIGVPKQRDDDMDDGVRKGVVTFFNESKGYGFIRDARSQESIFVHVNNAIDEIQERSKVVFEVEMGPKGPSAIKVKLAD